MSMDSPNIPQGTDDTTPISPEIHQNSRLRPRR